MTSSEIVHSVRNRLGTVGVWLGVLGRAPIDEERQAARRIEALGYGSIWTPEGIGGKEAFAHQAVLLAATQRIVTGTGIANVWARHPATMQGGAATLGAAYPGRFVLGIGISHAPAVERSGQAYEKPLQHMALYLDGMDVAVDTAPATVPVPRVLAALRPNMFDLARDRAERRSPVFRASSAHPYRPRSPRAGQAVDSRTGGGGEPDPDVARRIARDQMRGYLRLPNYINNLRYFGYTEDDVSAGGSDRLHSPRIVMASTWHRSATSVGVGIPGRLSAWP